MNNTSLFGFVLAALVVLLIPGPGVLYVVTRSLIQGRRAGLISVLGLSAGPLYMSLRRLWGFLLFYSPRPLLLESSRR